MIKPIKVPKIAFKIPVLTISLLTISTFIITALGKTLIKTTVYLLSCNNAFKWLVSN